MYLVPEVGDLLPRLAHELAQPLLLERPHASQLRLAGVEGRGADALVLCVEEDATKRAPVIRSELWALFT